ncbi:MAG: class I tRNA ligase family protein, partial [Dehalococcoidia bacterium]
MKQQTRIERYDPSQIETRWQERWEQDGLYKTPDTSERPPYYFLTMYPYPSGDLHTGHWYAETPPDTRARYLRMKGYNVLFPYGFDAFGLPAENAAIRNNIHPYKWTMANIDRMRNQAKRMGTMFDWSREVITCLPEYYKWNQWFFLQFLKNGLAYRQKGAVDWCPNCNTTLAREQVIGDERRCERCGTQVIKRDLEQWYFRTTHYAEEMLNFEGLDWPERVKTMQTNWIGRSEGANIRFETENAASIEVFTTRPDTIYGVTFMVLAPEHPLVEQLTTPDRKADVAAYVEQAKRQTEIERTAADKTKTGVFIGAYCTNPFSGERVPVYVGDYVLASYGTGAVMGVPAHDERDFDFAKKYGIAIPVVIAPEGWDGGELEAAYTDPGTMVNSGPFDGTYSVEGKRAVIAYGE